MKISLCTFNNQKKQRIKRKDFFLSKPRRIFFNFVKVLDNSDNTDTDILYNPVCKYHYARYKHFRQ